jgi:hypothetical protein
MELPHLEFNSSREWFSLAFVSPLSRNHIRWFFGVVSVFGRFKSAGGGKVS